MLKREKSLLSLPPLNFYHTLSLSLIFPQSLFLLYLHSTLSCRSPSLYTGLGDEQHAPHNAPDPADKKEERRSQLQEANPEVGAK